jgi:hypothetical protein
MQDEKKQKAAMGAWGKLLFGRENWLASTSGDILILGRRSSAQRHRVSAITDL